MRCLQAMLVELHLVIRNLWRNTNNRSALMADLTIAATPLTHYPTSRFFICHWSPLAHSLPPPTSTLDVRAYASDPASHAAIACDPAYAGPRGIFHTRQCLFRGVINRLCNFIYCLYIGDGRKLIYDRPSLETTLYLRTISYSTFFGLCLI